MSQETTELNTDPLTPEDIEQLLDVGTSDSPTAIRNRALVSLLHHAGLRSGEALSLTLGDIDLADQTLSISGRRGKGSRSIPINEIAVAYLEKWLETRTELGLSPEGPIFSTLKGKRLSSRYVREFLARYGEKAGIKKRVNPRALRDARARVLAEQKLPLSRIKAQLGHSNASRTGRYLRSLGLDATGLEDWADTRESQHRLHELVRSLVHATGQGLTRVSIRGGSGVNIGGWDGLVEASQGTAFVPAGLSCWEMGTSKEVERKANSDYRERAASPGDVDPATSTFVFVTPRRWAGKDDWAKKRRAEGTWEDVHVIDADDLEAWIELAPAVGARFARLLGSSLDGVGSLFEYADSFCQATEPPLSRSVLGIDNEEDRQRVLDWLAAPASVLEIEGESPEHALAFLSAALHRAPEEELDRLAARSLVLDDARSWTELMGLKQGLVVAVTSGKPDDVSHIRSEGNHVAIALGPGGASSNSALVLSRSPRPEFVASLEAMGLPRERAESLATETGRSLTVLRRRLAEGASLASPSWSDPAEARLVIPAMLAGGFNEANSADLELIERLSGREVRDYLRDLSGLASGTDAPLRRVGSTWRLTAPVDAWSQLARHLTAQDLEAFRDGALSVLGEADPAIELDPGDRWLAPAKGLTRRYSGLLRNKIAESLPLLAIYAADHAGQLPTTPQAVVDSVVDELLRDNSWADHRDLLPVLAEAAPDVFLRAIEDALDDDGALADLFVREGPFGGSTASAPLLWALESLAWRPQYLGRVALALARLDALDSDGNHGNRPARCLKQIFLPWLRQTSASIEDRLKSLDLLIEHEPAAAHRLLVSLLPSQEVAFPLHQPRFRDWDSRVDKQVTRGEYFELVQSIIKRLLEEAERDPALWVPILKKFRSFSEEDRTRIREQLLSKVDALDPGQRFETREALRELVANHRQYPDADWAFSDAELGKLEALLTALDLEDPLERHRWLFDSDWPDLPTPDVAQYEVRLREIRKARISALEEVVAEHQLEGLLKLAQSATHPRIVGTEAAHVLDDEQAFQLTNETIASDDARLRALGGSLVAEASRLQGDVWNKRTIDRAQELGWSAAKIASLAAPMAANRHIWDLVDSLGSEVATAYWDEVFLWRLEDASEVDFAARRLLGAERGSDTIHMLWLSNTEDLEPEVIEAAFECFATVEEDPRRGRPSAHEVCDVFETLKKKNPPPERLARIEWLLLPILTGSSTKPEALFQELADNPGFFVQVLSWVYLGEERQPDPWLAEGLTEEQFKARAGLAYQLLEAWDLPPGSLEGALNEDQLLGWIDQARRLAIEVGRGSVCDSHIGKILARAAPDPDGMWPSRAVRAALERTRSRKLEQGFRIEVYNSRGVVSRGPGGDQERELEQRYLNLAEEAANTHPRTATLLESIARSFAEDARRWDLDE